MQQQQSKVCGKHALVQRKGWGVTGYYTHTILSHTKLVLSGKTSFLHLFLAIAPWLTHILQVSCTSLANSGFKEIFTHSKTQAEHKYLFSFALGKIRPFSVGRLTRAVGKSIFGNIFRLCIPITACNATIMD